MPRCEGAGDGANLTAVPYLAGVAARLEEERLTVVEAGAAKRLALGEPVDLSEEVAANPLRERLCALAVWRGAGPEPTPVSPVARSAVPGRAPSIRKAKVAISKSINTYILI
ncbi:BTAD domain-containing putative transcriptional regulator [Streptosporangium sp. NPDC051023]|uniref:BTAD domain-containing putative transcriptional regulator n=1 Tax=Streptosporangium sp. NPDC051023 TaxID=3155410 RepID=UPI00344EA41E